MRTLSYAQAVNEAMHQAMADDENVIAYGLGVGDPKQIFGTTEGLLERFGPDRVFDMPTAENAMTGVAVGAALNGIRPVMVHQRLDFFLLAMDQLVNSAAKWHFMFGGQDSVPMVIRLILGQGWGQGPTHAQQLQAWFAHIPGLKVIMPTTAYDAKGMLLSAIEDNNPVVMLEHRWLHATESEVPEERYRLPLNKARVVREGSDLTIVALSYMTVEALHAAEHLARQGVECEIVDLRSVNPIDWETVLASVRKTGTLIALDTASETLSVGSEVIARSCREAFEDLNAQPVLVAMQDDPSPTSFGLTKHYYKRAEEIVEAAGTVLKKTFSTEELSAERTVPHDVPGNWFKGPF